MRRDDDGPIAAAAQWEPTEADIEYAIPVDDEPSADFAAPAMAPPLPRAVRALDAPPPEPIGWAVQDLILAGELALLCADSGAGKSTLALHIAAAVAGGYPVFGRFRTEARPVLYCSEEDGPGILAHRLGAIVAGHGWDRTRSLGNVHFFARAGVSLADAAWQRQLRSEVQHLEAGLVVLDPWADLLGELDENSNSEIRRVIQFARSLTEDGATPLIVHHMGKLGEGKRSVDRIRGASALNNASRSTYFVENRPDSFGIECLKLSRAPRLPTFTIARHIEVDPDNRAMWRSAKFLAISPRERATKFVLEAVRHASATTTDLKDAAKGKGVSGEDVGLALTVLQETGKITFDSGTRGAKHWRLVEQLDLASASGKVGKTTLPTLPDLAPGNHASPPSHAISHLAPPKGGKVNGQLGDAVAEQSGNLETYDER